MLLDLVLFGLVITTSSILGVEFMRACRRRICGTATRFFKTNSPRTTYIFSTLMAMTICHNLESMGIALDGVLDLLLHQQKGNLS
jgi:hypothetical protein